MHQHRFFKEIQSTDNQTDSKFDTVDDFISLESQSSLPESKNDSAEEIIENELTEALENQDSNPADPEKLGQLFAMLAEVYRFSNRTFEAFQKTQQGIEVWLTHCESEHGESAEAVPCPVPLLISSSYDSLLKGDLASADSFARQALRQINLDPQSESIETQFNVETDMSDSFALLGILDGLNGRWTLCKSHLKTALAMHLENFDHSSAAADLLNLGEFATRNRQFKFALTCFDNAFEYIENFELTEYKDRLEKLRSNALRLRATIELSPYRN